MLAHTRSHNPPGKLSWRPATPSPVMNDTYASDSPISSSSLWLMLLKALGVPASSATREAPKSANTMSTRLRHGDFGSGAGMGGSTGPAPLAA